MQNVLKMKMNSYRHIKSAKFQTLIKKKIRKSANWFKNHVIKAWWRTMKQALGILKKKCIPKIWSVIIRNIFIY